MAGNVLKILGFAATAAGIVAGMVSDYVKEKREDEKIKEEAQKAVKEYIEAEYTEVEEV